MMEMNLFAPCVAVKNHNVSIPEFVRMLRSAGVQISQLRFYQWLRANGWLGCHRRDYNRPTDMAIRSCLLDYRLSKYWVGSHVKCREVPVVTPRGQRYFMDGFLSGRFELGKITNQNN